MNVRAKEMCFIGGSRRRPGQVFEFDGKVLPAFLEAVEGSEPAPVEDQHDEAEEVAKLRVKLAEYGIKAAPRTGKEKLLEMVAEAEGKFTAAG